MNPLPEYTRVRTTNFAQFYSEGTLPAGIEAVVVYYDGYENKYIIEAAFPSDSLVGSYYYDTAEVDRDDIEVIK